MRRLVPVLLLVAHLLSAGVVPSVLATEGCSKYVNWGEFAPYNTKVGQKVTIELWAKYVWTDSSVDVSDDCLPLLTVYSEAVKLPVTILDGSVGTLEKVAEDAQSVTYRWQPGTLVRGVPVKATLSAVASSTPVYHGKLLVLKRPGVYPVPHLLSVYQDEPALGAPYLESGGSTLPWEGTRLLVPLAAPYPVFTDQGALSATFDGEAGCRLSISFETDFQPGARTQKVFGYRLVPRPQAKPGAFCVLGGSVRYKAPDAPPDTEPVSLRFSFKVRIGEKPAPTPES